MKTLHRYFYPRPPRGGRHRRIVLDALAHADHFYPRPPRGGRQHRERGKKRFFGLFLSTPSARRATERFNAQRFGICDFYPRPPRGGRPQSVYHALLCGGFLSTPSARRATHSGNSGSIATGYFYPRPPRGGRLEDDILRDVARNFYPRPPRGGRPPTSWA